MSSLYSLPPPLVCWLPAHWQRHGQPNKEINGNKSIQWPLLTFARESQWCLWHPGGWHYDWYATLHYTKRQNTELQIGCTQKETAVSVFQTSWLRFQLALQWERAKVHASSLRGCQDKSRTGKRKERSHLTTFNNKVPETDPICLVDEEPLLLFLDLIKLSNVLIFNVGASAESSLTDAPPPQFNKKAISVCRQITGSLHTTYALSFESYVYFPKTRQQLSHRHCH